MNVKHLWKTRKKAILSVTAVVTAAAIGCGIWYSAGHSSKEPVYVFPFEYVGMTEYWGDSQESYGPVTTDKIQTVFLSDTQTVTEILVQAGDTVKKGDLLMTFDTTLSDLQLERKRLDVEKLKLQLEDAHKELGRINSMKPMVIPDYTEDEGGSEEELGVLIDQETKFQISTNSEYDGSSQEKALICWIAADRQIDDTLFEVIRLKAQEHQILNLPEEPEVPEDGTEPTENPGDEGGEETESTEATENTEEPVLDIADLPVPGSELPEQNRDITVTDYYVVFRITGSDRLLGDKKVWQGMRVSGIGSDFSFRLVEAVIPDHMMAGGDTSVNTPEIDFGSGYTAAQIAQMRSDQQKKIKELEFNIKMADAEYKIMLTEVSDGNVYSDIDGEVVSVLTEEEAKQTMQPIVKVSGGGGFYVEGAVSELEKENLRLGQEVTVNDWNTGMTYTGTIESMGDFPSSSGHYNGMGNPNASYYPFKVFVDGSADLQAGNYVSVMYSAAESQHGVYLQNPFLRTEQGKSYVYVLGENGKLEQRFVTTGKSLWGSYMEILEGLTAEDLVAFPYGKNVKPGVAAQEGDMSNLYG